MNYRYEELTAQQARAVLGAASYCVLCLTDGSTPYAVPAFFTWQMAGEGMVFRLRSAAEGRKLACLRRNARAGILICLPNGAGYDSVWAEGVAQLEPAACRCPDKLEVELAVRRLSGRRWANAGCMPDIHAHVSVPPRAPVRALPDGVKPLDERTPPAPLAAMSEGATVQQSAADTKRAARPGQPVGRCRLCNGYCFRVEHTARLLRQYGARPRESIALKLEAGEAINAAEGALLTGFDKVRESDVASYHESTGRIFFHKDSVCRLNVQLSAKAPEDGRLRLGLWCRSAGCMVETMPFSPAGDGSYRLTDTIVFHVTGEMYDFTLKNASDGPLTAKGVLLFEKL